MIFKPNLADKAVKRLKTQTRRIKKEGERMITFPSGKVVHGANGHVKWRVGETYAIQPGRGKAAIGRLKLLDIRRERLQDGKWGWGHYEGYKEGVEAEKPGITHIPDEKGVFWTQDKLLFRRLWDSINSKPGQRWEDNPEVWVLVFEVEGKVLDES